VYASLLGAGESVTHEVAPDRHAWIHVARGRVRASGAGGDRVSGGPDVELAAGDGASTSDAGPIAMHGLEPSEVLVFDLD
jgi:hypothetical protein